MNISYPITAATRKELEARPTIAQAFSLPNSDRSNREIVRILSNTHFPHLDRQLDFIDQWLTASGPIGRKLLKVTDPFELEQTATELALFVHLRSRLGDAVEATESGGDTRCPDMEVKLANFDVRLEVYTPVDLHGYQLFDRGVQYVLNRS